MAKVYLLFLWVALWAAGFVGWIINLVAFCRMLDEPMTTELVLRALGIVVLPIGAVLGYAL